MNEKQCSKCGEYRTEEEFFYVLGIPQGHCKSCLLGDVVVKSLDDELLEAMFEAANSVTLIPPTPANKSVVYFVQAEYQGLIKIGYTINPQRRFSSMFGQCPCPLKVLGCMMGTREHEASLHSQFYHILAHHEWYYPKPELLNYIAENCTPVLESYNNCLTPRVPR